MPCPASRHHLQLLVFRLCHLSAAIPAQGEQAPPMPRASSTLLHRQLQGRSNIKGCTEQTGHKMRGKQQLQVTHKPPVWPSP